MGPPHDGIGDGTGERAADTDPLRVLFAIARQRRALDVAELELIERARREGATLGSIGTALGVSRQAIHEKLTKAKNGALAVGLAVNYDDLLDAAASLLT